MPNQNRPSASALAGWSAGEWRSAHCWCRSRFTLLLESTTPSMAAVLLALKIASAVRCGNSSSQRSRLSPAASRDLSLPIGSADVALRSREHQRWICPMPLSICTACGTQYPESPRPPEQCVICEEERQYVPPRGQTWTTLDALSKSHMNGFHEYDTGIIGIGSQPSFAIGQRALLVRTERGNVLWDCIATLDMATINMIKGLGGLKAIAISHPHFYTTMVEWARAFDCPIHLNAADSDWIMRKDDAIKLWTGDTLRLWDGVTLVRCGGHFPGGTVMHWAG